MNGTFNTETLDIFCISDFINQIWKNLNLGDRNCSDILMERRKKRALDTAARVVLLVYLNNNTEQVSKIVI